MNEVGNSSSAASYSPLRIAALRVLAAAHVIVGLAELSRVAGNLLLQESYMGGLMGLFGALTIQFVQLFNSLLLVSPADLNAFWLKSAWIVRTADSSHPFFVAMMAAHFALGMFNLVLGQGLWRRRPWARQIEIILVGLAGSVAAAHGIALLWVVRLWSDLGVLALVTSIPVVVPIWIFLMLPGTAALFRESTSHVPVVQRRRPWWMLSFQMFAGLAAFALALGLLLVFNLGPMVEVAWVVIQLTTSGLL